ncbi:MAG: hypothetical protein A3G76_05670 [Acidobacteria bacterium RIFCSPLOWO2_12_FULL_65_11]|nr:MAG: hypothetical protein A3G76_05670 [Acidobacteria bacterium RIFCSPLOWO2_12_FULL_65_11]
MRVDAQGDRRILVAELPAHIRDGDAGLQQQRGERVPHLMRPSPMQLRLVEELIEHLPSIRPVKGRTDDRGEHPRRQGLTEREPSGPLLTPPQPQHAAQLAGEVDTPRLVVLGRRQGAVHQVPLYLNEPTLPINVAPLQGEQLA